MGNFLDAVRYSTVAIPPDAIGVTIASCEFSGNTLGTVRVMHPPDLRVPDVFQLRVVPADA